MEDKKTNAANGFNPEGATASADPSSVAKSESVISDIQSPRTVPAPNSFTVEDPSAEIQLPPSPNTSTPISHPQGFTRFKPLLIVSLFIFGLCLAGFLGYKQLSSQGQQNANSADAAAAYGIQKLDLQDLANSGSLGLATSQSLSVNGQLRTNNSLVLSPTAQPAASSATAGQLYYDKTGNALAYYNGTQFISLMGTNDLDTLRAELVAINARVSGIPPAATIPSDLATLSANNNFTGNNTLGPTAASSLVLASPLDVSSGGTGANSLTANGVLIGRGTSPVGSVSANAANLCLMSTSGAPVFSACPGGVGSGVNSLNGLMGTLNFANATGSGTTITIDNASATAKGIASFNTSNFSVSGGAVNTIQDIGIGASVMFGGLTVNGSINGQTISANAGFTGDLTVAGAFVALSIQGDGSAVTGLNATNITSGTLADGRLGANVTLLGSSIQNAEVDDNLTISASGSVADGALSTNVTLQGNTFNGVSELVQLNNTGGLPALNGSLLTSLNASNISSGTLADGRLSANVSLLGASITSGEITNNTILAVDMSTTNAGTNGYLLMYDQISGGFTYVDPASVVSTVVTGLTSLNGLTGGVTVQSLSTPLTVAASGSNVNLTLGANVALYGAATSNFTGTLQQGGNNVCTAANNCGYLTGSAANGSYIQLQATTPGTAQTGNLNISGTAIAGTFSGNGSGVTNVNATQLGGQAGSYYQNATNLNAGTLADGRLSANVALLGAVTNAFTGTVQGNVVNATGSIQLNGVNINTAGTLNNVAYLNQTNTFSAANTFSTSVTTPLVQGAVGGALTLTGNAASTWSTSAGNLTLQAGSGTISLGSTTSLTSAGALTVTGGATLSLVSTGANAISLDSGTTGAINIGTSANAKTLTIGNTTGATALLLRSGTGNISLTGATTVTGAATVTGNLIGNVGLYTGAGAGTLRISSAGALSNVSIPTASTITVGSANAFGILYTNSSNVLQFANINGTYGSTTKCLMSDGTTGLGFGTCPGGGGGGGGWGLTGSDAAGSILGSNTATTANFVISSRPNNVAATSSGASYISFSGHQFSSPNRIIIAGNPNSNSNQGGGAWSSGNNADYFRIQNSAGDVAFAVQGSAASQQVFVNLMAASSVGANGKVCSTISQGSSGMGTLAACSSGVDLAEAYNSTQSLVPGEIVAVDPDNYPNVLRSSSASQETLMGIVSTEPDHVMGQDLAPNGYPIALNGRVPTKVNAEGGPILPGDKITSSSVPGVGKKATDHGMIVGTALTGFSGTGQGVVEVFVHLDYYEPPVIDSLQANSGNFTDLNVSGTATINSLIVTTAVVSGDLTVSGKTSVQSIIVNGHIITSSGQPVASVDSAAGAGASVVIDGNDTAGNIQITTGVSELTVGNLATFSFSETYGKIPRIIMTGQDGASVKASLYPSGKTLESFSLRTDEALTPNTTYTFDYFIVE